MYRAFFKRAFDICFSVAAVTLLLPVFIAIPLMIMITERTFNVLYISIRIGQNGRAFKFYKFRTMNINCYQKEVFTKEAGDDRITKIGRILRKCSLDELPQFFNVLIGDMSIVGNRPLPVREAAPLYTVGAKRFGAPAGITGLWQVNKSRANTLQKRWELDDYYVDNVTCKTDAGIVVKTVVQMFKNY